jgi:hypothetical protein
LTRIADAEILPSVTEDEGTALLFVRFTEAGYRIARDFHFDEGGVQVDLDGWDASARVGYEYITAEAGDHRQFDAETLARLEERMAKGELHVFLIDEHDAMTEASLDSAARGFLAALAEHRKPGSV